MISTDDPDYGSVEALLGWLRTVADANSGVTRIRVYAHNKHTGDDVETPEPLDCLPLELLLPELEAIFETARRYRTVLDIARDVSSIIRGEDP
jgi:hypothetical protein